MPTSSWSKLAASVLVVSSASGAIYDGDGPTPATSNSEAPTAAPTPVSRSFGTMSPTSVEPIIPEATGTPGFCTFVDTVVGIEKEEGQDRLSVQEKDGLPVAFENKPNYVRMLTIFGNARTEFYFSPPSALLDGTASSITVEMSALVSAPGSGSAWTVGLSNGGEDTVAVGDLATAGASEWTTTAITVPLAAGDDGSLANYLDASGEMLITLSSASPDSTQVVFVDYMVITAHTGGTFEAAMLTPSPVGACAFVDTVIGVEKEEGQDRLSVRSKNDVMVSRENMPNYVRMLTIFGNAETDFYFTPPASVADGTATAIAVEMSALVPTESSGDVWTLSIDNGKNGTHVPGVFSTVGTNWTTVSVTFIVDDGAAAGYVGDNGEIQLSVSCSEPDSTQVLFVDFMEVTAGEVGLVDPFDDGAYYIYDNGNVAQAAEVDEDAQVQDTAAAHGMVSGGFFPAAAATVVAASCASLVLSL